MFCRIEPDDFYSPSPEWMHIDEHQEAMDELQNIIDRAKEELINLKEAILSGDLKKIADCAEEVYGYLED